MQKIVYVINIIDNNLISQYSIKNSQNIKTKCYEESVKSNIGK
jgi:hypothetical protein